MQQRQRRRKEEFLERGREVRVEPRPCIFGLPEVALVSRLHPMRAPSGLQGNFAKQITMVPRSWGGKIWGIP